jgi:hypothetical protein
MLTQKSFTRNVLLGIACSVGLTSLAMADLVGSGKGTCDGARQCDGSNPGPDGVPWNQKSCQGKDPAEWRGYVGVIHCRWSTAALARCTEYDLLCYHGHIYANGSSDCNGPYTDVSDTAPGCQHPTAQ